VGTPLWSAAPSNRHQHRVAGAYVVDIFDEVEEELRAERAQLLLKRYGGVILAAAVAIVGIAAGWQGWRWYEARRDQAAAVQFLTAMSLADATVAGSSEASRAAGTAAFSQLAAKAPQGYAVLAKLREAALKADAGDLQGAAALWDQVAGDSSADPLLRDLATLLWAQHAIDKADPSVLEARLRALAMPDNPWRALAEEQLALLDLRQGKADQAKAALRHLAADATAPSGVRGRASALLGRMGG
jgi:hypothetical protein